MNRFRTYWRHWLMLGVGLGVSGAWLVVNIYQEHSHIESVERERLAAQSKVIEVNLTRQLVAINLALESVMAELPVWANQPDGQQRAVRQLQRMEASMPSVRTFLVLDGKGVVTLSNRVELTGNNFFQRDYFQAPLRSLNPKRLHVSEPFKTVLGVYGITLSRAMVDANGKLVGVAAASVDPVDIEILLNSVRYADDMHSMLVHGDGTIFVSQPALAEVIGKNLSVAGSFFRDHRASQRPVSHFKGVALSSGDQRLSVLRTIEPADLAMNKPLLVSLSRGRDALYADWQRDTRNQLLSYLLLGLLSSASLYLFLRQQARQRFSDQRLQLATAATGVGIWEFDLQTRRYHWDAKMFELFGLDPQATNRLRDDWKQLLLPGELERIRAATRMALDHAQPFDLTFQVRRKDGQLRFMHNRAAMHEEDSGTRTRMIGTTEDVTERELRRADLRIAATAFESHESMLVTDHQSVILRVNRAFSNLFGYSAEEVLGRTPRLLQSGQHEPAFYTAMWAAVKNDRAWQGEIWNRRKNGEVFPVWLSITAVCSEEGVVTHYVGNHTDITLRKAADEAIKQLAFYDPLTRLPNRRLLQDRLRQAMAHAKRDGHRLALIFTDLDKFKPVNDEFGHPAGDELLQAVAHRLQACVRESDTVARVGGDEFVVLLPRIDAAQDALGVAEKIHEVLKQPFPLNQGVVVSISSSSGIALYPDHASDEATLTNHADAAMYQAKAAGRDRYVLFETAA